MGILSRLKAAADVLVGRAAASYVGGFITGRPTFPTPGFGTLAQEGFEKNAIVYAGIMEIATSVPESPLRYRKRGSREPVESGPMSEALAMPSSWFSETDLWELSLVHLYLSGNFYWEKVRTRGGRVKELWPLRPDRVSIVPGKEQYVDAYRYRIDDREFSLPAADVSHHRWPHPRNDFFGFPPLAAALRALATDNEAVDFAKALLENNALPGGLLKVSKDIDQVEADRLKDRFVEKFSGSKRGAPVVLKPGMDFEPISFDLEKVAFESVRNISTTEVLAVLGVPPILIGALVGLERSTFANFAEARRAFHDETIAPLQRKLASRLSADPDFCPLGSGLEVYFDDSQVSALADMRAAKATATVASWNAGLLTLDQALAELGYPPVGGEEGAQRKQPAPSVFGGTAEQDSFPPGKGRRGRKGRKAQDPLDLLADNLDSLSFAELWEARMRSTAKSVFRAQAREARAAFSSWSKSRPEVKAATFTAAMMQAVKGALENLSEGWTKQAFEEFRPLIVKLLGGSAKLKAQEIEVAFDLDDAKVREFIETYGYKFAQKLGRSSLEELRAVLAAGQDEGLTVDQVSSRLEDVFHRWTSARADMVARSETMRAGNRGVKLAYQEAGVTRLEWDAASDPCPICQALDGKQIGIDEAFVQEGGSFQYADGDVVKTFLANYETVETPPAHPNCRCTISALD